MSLRPALAFEGLERRDLLASTNWTNPLQRLNVSGDAQQLVSPLDVVLVINELNHPDRGAPGTGKLPVLPDTATDPHPYLDVSCDGFVAPLDAIQVINAINHNSFPTPWNFSSANPSGVGGVGNGYITSVDCGPKLNEGSSYLTAISTEVTIPHRLRISASAIPA